jgi:hypothetical protein
MTQSQSRVEIFSRSTLLTGSIKKRAVSPPSFLSFFRRFVFRAFRGAASRMALRRRGAPQGYDLRPRLANRCLSEVIADVRASPKDDPSGPSDSRPRREASPSAAARLARRRERSELVPVGAAFSVPFLAGQKGDIPTRPTDRMTTRRRGLTRHQDRRRSLPAQRSPTECRRTRLCGGSAVRGGQCDWPHRRQGGRPRNP